MLTRPGWWQRSLALTVTALAACTAAALVPAGPARADSVRNSEQWVLNELDVLPAWSVTRGKGVVVAVIDSGVDPAAPDLAGSVITGRDFSGVRTPASNPNWGIHGTWMASLIAGHGHGIGNASGIIGTAPQARVLSIRVITDSGDPNNAAYEREPAAKGQRELARAITFAVRSGAEVISMSLGYSEQSRPVRAALQDAYRHNVVVVASAGNSGDLAGADGTGNAPYSFPANYPGVLAVAAVNSTDQVASFSSENLSVQVAAPGYKVPAEGRYGTYWWVSGTSPACALTAGVVALIKSKYPRLTDSQVISAITSTTAKRTRPRGGYDEQIGFGVVDAAAALTAAGKLAVAAAPPAGMAPAGHFGGGAAAVPAPPVSPRGPASLILYCLLGAACLAAVAVATSRLLAQPEVPASAPQGPGDLDGPGAPQGSGAGQSGAGAGAGQSGDGQGSASQAGSGLAGIGDAAVPAARHAAPRNRGHHWAGPS